MIHNNTRLKFFDFNKYYFIFKFFKNKAKRVGFIDLLLLVAIICFGLYCFKMCNRMEILIYHGPYSAYTPISLQKRIQEKYDAKLSIWDSHYILRAVVETVEELDYIPSWMGQLGKEKPKRQMAHLYSINSATWLRFRNLDDHSFKELSKKYLDGDSMESNELRVIGYKKQDILYYMPLFIWHVDSLMYNIDSVIKKNGQFVLNRKGGSGCSNMVASMYLLDQYKKASVFLMSKKDMVQEVISKKQLVGVISTDEYSGQLDMGQKGRLFIQPIPVNIPLDPIVIRKSEWERLSPASRDHVKKLLIKQHIMIDSEGEEGEKMRCLNDMLYFYLSMPVLSVGKLDTVEVLHRGIDEFNVRCADVDTPKTAYLCKVDYARLGKEYYSFEKVDVDSLLMSEAKSYIIDQDVHEKVVKGYNRVVSYEQKDEFDRLMMRYNMYFR